MKLNFHRSSRKAVLLSIIDDDFTEKYVDPMLGFHTHKTRTPRYYIDVKGVEKGIVTLQEKLYVQSLQPDSLFRYEPSDRFPNERGYGVQVVSNQRINRKQQLKLLAGQCFDIDESDIRKGINDFSLLCSYRTNKQMMFLGPVAYVNHDCESNCCWSSLVSKSYVNLVAIKQINPNEEITAYYGDNFFGINNENCRCMTCEIASKGAFKPRMYVRTLPVKSIDDQVTQVENIDDDQVQIENQITSTDTDDDDEKEVHDALAVPDMAPPSVLESQVTNVENMDDDQVQIENQITSTDTNDDDEKQVHDALAVADVVPPTVLESQVTQVENMDDDQVQIENQITSTDTDDDDEKEVHDVLAVDLSSSDNYFSSDSEDGATDIDNALKYECKKCKIMFRFKSWFNRHISTHDPASFQCKYCPKVFKRNDTLGEHISRHVGGRVFQCIDCLKKFSDRRNLKAHQTMIHNSNPIQCLKCKNMYADSRQLRYHNLRMHTKEKIFHCECKASFAVPSMLSKHRTKMNHPRPK